MRYPNWTAVRNAITIKQGEIPDQIWELLREYLWIAAVHPPCDDADIDFACKKLRMITRTIENEEG